jgi:hypothetical protein
VHELCVGNNSHQCFDQECGVAMFALERGSVTIACERPDHALDGPLVIESPEHTVLAQGVCAADIAVGAWLGWERDGQHIATSQSPEIFKSDGLWLTFGTDDRVHEEGQLVRTSDPPKAIPAGFEWRREENGSLGKYDSISGAKIP